MSEAEVKTAPAPSNEGEVERRINMIEENRPIRLIKSETLNGRHEHD